MTISVLAGFVPLVDSAVLVAAREKGFAAEHGIDLSLVKEPSWASLRDHLNLGHIDCAHALAPLPIAAVLGIGQVRARLAVPFVLGRGGNAITVSTSLADQMRSQADGHAIQGSKASGAALAKVTRRRSDPLTLAMVYPFSGHNFEIRYWLAEAGIHPDVDVRLVAIPPPLMVESLRAGQVDGFCVGEPWNSLAVSLGLGEIVATKSEIFPRGIEKVLALPESSLADTEKIQALLKCCADASSWCDQAEHRHELAEILGYPEYLGVSAELILRALEGRVFADDASGDPDFLYFSRHDGSRPRTREAMWIYAQMRRWGQLPMDRFAEKIAARVFRPDVFDAVLNGHRSMPAASIIAYDDMRFDGLSVSDYVDQFDMSTPYAISTDTSS